MFRFFGFSALLTVASVIGVLVGFGPGLAVTTCVLIAIEIAFSFDNAVINAKVLAKLSHFWQQIFLTVGMLIAIVGMRLIFPILIVMITADLSWGAVLNDALHHPDVYGEHLAEAHPTIAAFGGSFLLLLSLYFLFDDERQDLWLKRIERPLQQLGGKFWLPPFITAIVVVIISRFAGHESSEVLRAGLVGIVVYTAIKLLIDGIGKLTGSDKSVTHYTGWSAFLAFVYLEVLDASFSFDGVLGAFAITDKVLVIVIGLGVGAIWVRSLTVYMVRKGTLNTYKYLEHGAHYAILILSFALLASLFYEIPDAVTGIAGLGIIGASFVASRQAHHAR